MANPYQPSLHNSTVRRQYAAPGWFAGLMRASAIVMTIVTLVLAGWSIESEPFFGPFDLQQAMISVVGGGFGMLFWIAWAGGFGYAVMRRWVPISIWLILIILLAFIGFGLNYIVVFDYLGDRENWVTQ